jgi:hypothetical protein
MEDKKLKTIKMMKRYKFNKQSINNMKMELEELRLGVDLYSSPLGNVSEGKTSKVDGDEKVLSYLIRKEDLENRIQIIQSEVDRVSNALATLDECKADILTLYYIKGHGMDFISYKTHFSKVWCFKLKEKAIEEVTIGLWGEAFENEGIFS